MVKKNREKRNISKKNITKTPQVANKNRSFYGLFVFAVAFLVLSLIGASIVDLSERGMLNITGNMINGFVGFVDSVFGTSALSQTSIARSFSVSSYTVGSPFVVTLTINAGSADRVINYGITESVPAGFTVSAVSSSDFFNVNGNEIIWIVNSSNNNTNVATTRTLTYTVTPTTSGLKTFNGSAIFTSTSPTLRQEFLQTTGSSSINTAVVVTQQLSVTMAGTGSVSSSPAGINSCTTGTCTANYNNGTNVVLTATAQSGVSTFSGWSGYAGCTTSTTCTVNMSQARSVTATFANVPFNYSLSTSAVTVTQSSSSTQTITITHTQSANPESVTVSVSGLPSEISVDSATKSCTPATLGTCSINFVYTATSTAPVTTTSATLVSSSASTSSRSTTFAFSVTSTPTSTLTSVVNGLGTVSSNPSGINCGNGNTDCTENYNNGTSVILTANAVAGNSTFTSWGGACLASDVTNGLVANWKFDQSSGSTTTDSSGNGNTLSITGTPTFVAGNSGNALQFTGSNSAFESAINLASTSNFTISSWTNFATLPTGVIFETTNNYNNFNTGVLVVGNTGTAPCAGLGSQLIEVAINGNVGRSQKCYNYPGNGWHHYTFVFNKALSGANEVAFYVDGVLQTSLGGASNDNNNLFGNDPIYLMSRGGSVINSSGVLDEVRVYNRALTSSEVTQLYSGTGSSGNTCTVNMSQARTITANFTSVPYNYTLSAPSAVVMQSSSVTQNVVVTKTAGAVAESTTVTVSGLPGTVSVDSATKSCTPTSGSCTIPFTYTAQAGATAQAYTVNVASSSVSVPTRNTNFVLTVTSLPMSTLNIAVTGTGTVTGNGINCGDGNTDCSEVYNNGTSVVLTANAFLGESTFSGWSGYAGCTTANTCTVNMSQARSITAIFAAVAYDYNVAASNIVVTRLASATQSVSVTYLTGATPQSTTLNIVGLPSGVNANVNPQSCNPSFGTCSVNFVYSANASAILGTRQVNVSSSYPSSSTKITSFTITVSDAPTNLLTTSATGAGSITASGINCGNGNTQCSASYINGTNVVLTATPASGAVFNGWNGAAASCGTTTTCTVNMSQARTLGATFNSVPSAVNAGIDQIIHVPTLATTLTGSASDDGIPAALTYTWSRVSGPTGVVFANANAVSTTVTFPTNGTYVLRFNASDSQLSASDDITVRVNAYPRVTVSGPSSITLPSTASLVGTSSDDGIPAALTYTWSRVSGPGSVTFNTPNALTTTATFSTNGTYVVRLNASDSVLINSSTLTIVVSPALIVPAVSISSPATSYTEPATITLNAVASDADGISQVRFYNGVNLLGSDSTSPYSITLSNVMTGNYQYIAQAIDNVGSTANSSTLGVTVSPAAPVDDDNDGVANPNDNCPSTTHRNVSIFGCPLPIANEFSRIYPNLTSSDLRAVPNPQIGNAFGNVSYAGKTLNLLNDYSSANAVSLNLNAGLDIVDGRITVEPTIVPRLNTSAILTFYNVNKPKPYVTQNSGICKGCTLVSYSRSSKILVVSVPHFSTYSISDVLPDSGEFDYLNVNLSDEYLDLINISGLSVGVNAYGRIDYIDNVTLLRENGTDVVGLNLSRFIDITSNRVVVDSLNAPELNKRATITFFNVAFTKPQILRDGVVCTDCTGVTYTNGTYSFVASGFSAYEVREEPTDNNGGNTGGGSNGGGNGGGSKPRTIVNSSNSNITAVGNQSEGSLLPGTDSNGENNEVPEETQEERPDSSSFFNIIIFLFAMAVIAGIIIVAVIISKKKGLNPSDFSADNVLERKNTQSLPENDDKLS